MTLACINAFAQENKPALDFFAALLPFVLSLVAAYIAFAQYRVNRNKLKFDLFEKRFKVFIAAKDFIAHNLTSQRPTAEAKLDFIVNTRGAEFLFDSNVKYIIDEIWKKSVDLESYSYDESTATHARERHASSTWLANKLNSIDDDFIKYMRVKH